MKRGNPYFIFLLPPEEEIGCLYTNPKKLIVVLVKYYSCTVRKQPLL